MPDLLSRIEKTDTCWLWKGRPNSEGYGQITVQGKNLRAHRYVYERLIGPILKNKQLDHLCRNRICVRPDHLEPVTRRVNILRGVSIVAECARKTHCKNGHPLTAPYIKPSNKGWRICRICHNASANTARNRRMNWNQ